MGAGKAVSCQNRTHPVRNKERGMGLGQDSNVPGRGQLFRVRRASTTLLDNQHRYRTTGPSFFPAGLLKAAGPTIDQAMQLARHGGPRLRRWPSMASTISTAFRAL